MQQFGVSAVTKGRSLEFTVRDVVAVSGFMASPWFLVAL